MNNFKFWEDYLIKLKEEIKKICQEKKELHIDLHIHSNYSSDGKQSIKEILNTTKNKGFDIIAITDHDSLDCYDELYEYVKNGMTYPLIIPGIEFTVDNRNYGNQCHILQLFVNPKDDVILQNVNHNYKAMFNRSKIQFQRINENQALQELITNKEIFISYDDYLKYLSLNSLIPEYDTLCSYLMEKLKDKGITTFQVFDLLKKYNENDCYPDRKKFKSVRYNKLEQKYLYNDDNKFNVRFLLSMLAVREVDDDWWNRPSCGSLSVNSFGQLKVEELNEKYPTYFAHPTEKKLSVVENIIKNKKSIMGLELNIRNKYDNIKIFYDLLKKYNLNMIIGSDSHDSTLKFYDDMNFYIIDAKELLKILN